MTNPGEDNVTPIRPGMELVGWEPADVPDVYDRDNDVTIYASILDVPRIAPPSEMRAWLDRCRGAISLRWYRLTVHATHAPLYIGRASVHSPRGLWTLLRAWFAWVRDFEMLDIIYRVATDNTIAANTQQNAHSKARHERTWRVRRRWAATGAATLTAALLYRYAWGHHPWLAILISVAVVVGLGLIGAQRGDVVQFVDLPTEKVISVDTVMRAFFKAKIAPKEDDPIKVLGVPHKEGLGVVVRVELPEGATFAQVLANRDALASGLHCPKQCLELDDLPDEQEALLELFIADKPASKVVVPPWALLDVDRFDVFRPIPVGWTPRGEVVALSLMWVHTLIGAAPRRGKTTILRMFALATLLDPRAQLIIVDFGGGSDYKPLRPFCLKTIHGPGEDKVREFLALLEWLDGEYNRRQTALDALPVSRAPEGRITPALAELPAFAPITVIVDEFQVATGATGKLGETVVKKWTELEKVCPKVGITFTAATQTADDSVPTELRNIALQRVALTMASYQASMAVLGNTAQKLGYDASTLGGLPGLAYSWGTDSGDTDGFRGKVRFANCTPVDAAALLERIARTRRTAVDATTRDLPPAKQIPGIVTAALASWPRPEMNCHQDVLAERMHMDQVDLGRSMRQAGIHAEPVKMRRPGDDHTTGRRGYRLVDLEAVTR